MPFALLRNYLRIYPKSKCTKNHACANAKMYALFENILKNFQVNESDKVKK